MYSYTSTIYHHFYHFTNGTNFGDFLFVSLGK